MYILPAFLSVLFPFRPEVAFGFLLASGKCSERDGPLGSRHQTSGLFISISDRDPKVIFSSRPFFSGESGR